MGALGCAVSLMDYLFPHTRNVEDDIPDYDSTPVQPTLILF
jgi:hypothetical protein